jgi:hypothetical protein
VISAVMASEGPGWLAAISARMVVVRDRISATLCLPCWRLKPGQRLPACALAGGVTLAR